MMFSDVFRGYRSGALVKNGLMKKIFSNNALENLEKELKTWEVYTSPFIITIALCNNFQSDFVINFFKKAEKENMRISCQTVITKDLDSIQIFTVYSFQNCQERGDHWWSMMSQSREYYGCNPLSFNNPLDKNLIRNSFQIASANYSSGAIEMPLN